MRYYGRNEKEIFKTVVKYDSNGNSYVNKIQVLNSSCYRKLWSFLFGDLQSLTAQLKKWYPGMPSISAPTSLEANIKNYWLNASEAPNFILVITPLVEDNYDLEIPYPESQRYTLIEKKYRISPYTKGKKYKKRKKKSTWPQDVEKELRLLQEIKIYKKENYYKNIQKVPVPFVPSHTLAQFHFKLVLRSHSEVKFLMKIIISSQPNLPI